MRYILDRADARPLYDQLYRAVREDVESGKLLADERMPSRRALSQKLGVSRATVESAYAQLVAEGYLRARDRSGYFVERVHPKGEAELLPVDYPPEASPNAYPVDFLTGASDARLFPFSVWAKLTRGVLLDYREELLKPTPFQGARALREELSRHLYRAKGISVDPAQIVVGAGSEYLYNLLVQLLGRTRVCAVENPGYALAARILALNGVRCVPVPMDARGARVDALSASDADAVVLSPSHHFPTGIVTSVGRRREILEWASARADRYVIENDYDSEFRFSGMPIPALKSIDADERVIYVNTFSKTIAPSVRVSFMALPKQLAEKCIQTLGFYNCTSPALEQYALCRFLSEGYFDKHIARMKRAYRQRRDQLIELIHGCAFNSMLAIHEEDAGLHFLLKVHTDIPDDQLKWALRRAGVRASCLSDYYLPGTQTPPAHMLIVNYSGVNMDAVAPALSRLEQMYL